ncbi:MAG TPA: hypothetical protein VGF17_15465 [Phytomonospora sp.]
MNARQHLQAAGDAMLDERPGLAEYHVARAELLAGRTGRTLDELVAEQPALSDVGVMPAISALVVMSA